MTTQEQKNKRKLKADTQRKMVAEIKLLSGCVDCGYRENAFALEFDHKDNSGIPYTGKSRTVASLMYSSWTVVRAEISKCEVVCCNCHAIRTFNRRFKSYPQPKY